MGKMFNYGLIAENFNRSDNVALAANSLHIAVRAGFSVENSKRATMLKFTNKFQTEALCPPDGNMFVMGCLFIPFLYFCKTQESIAFQLLRHHIAELYYLCKKHLSNHHYNL